MGSCFSKIRKRFHKKIDIRVLLLGLDNAGKTTTLYRLKVQSGVSTVPTIGFNVESYLLNEYYKLNIWDVGGQDKIRPLWRHYYAGSKALAFVVDSQDRERLEEAKRELWKVLKDPMMKDILFLVFANKQDLEGAMSTEELEAALDLNDLRLPYKIQKSCATTGDGLLDGFQWICESFEAQRKKKKSGKNKTPK